jgi:hypothetical protein
MCLERDSAAIRAMSGIKDNNVFKEQTVLR